MSPKKWLRRETILKEVSYRRMPNPRRDDIIIPVMGPTGSGKSTLINKILGKDEMTVGHSVNSCTSCVAFATLDIDASIHPALEGRRVVLVDTPGFDDTYVNDTEILKRCAAWLAESYVDGFKIAGIIYTHDISHTRMSGGARKNLELFQKMCGHRATRNVTLLTTRWEVDQKFNNEDREKELIGTHWKLLLDGNARVQRLQRNDHESAIGVLKAVLSNVNNARAVPLTLQEELVEAQMLIPETKAGRTLRYTLEELLAEQKQMAKALKSDPSGVDEYIGQQLEENLQKMTHTLTELKKMKVPLSRTILRFFGFK